MSLGSIHETSTLSSLVINLNRAELSLTSGVAVLAQAVLLLSSCMLLSRHNTAVLVENQLTLGKTAWGLVCGIVPHLGARPL